MGGERCGCITTPVLLRSVPNLTSYITHHIQSCISPMKQTSKAAMIFVVSSRFTGRFGPRSISAFSTLSPILATKLKDPSLVDCDTGTGETFSVLDPGASAEQFTDGTAAIAKVKRMGREDTKCVSLSYCFVIMCTVLRNC